MKKLFLLSAFLIVGMCSQAQNLLVFEALRGVNCSTNKIDPFLKCIDSLQKQKKLIVMYGDFNVKGVASDWFKRYTNASGYWLPGSQQARYNGMFGTPASVGSVWADNVNGIYNMAQGTLNKYHAMLNSNMLAAWNINGTYAVNNGYMNLIVNVQTNYPLPDTSLYLYVMLKEKYSPYHFIQYIGVPQRITNPNTNASVYYVTGQVKTATAYDVVLMVQDTKHYQPDIGTSLSNPMWGFYELPIYCAYYANIFKP